ncbi:MAG: MBL fold metallo-hydrolase [Bergeyella zoohelcum]|nr:MBL fold metallo-hydrolase [Bergeyella zoohelcum]
MKLKFLGTGTSQGVPVIGCQCPVCTSQDAKDKRFRTSAMITTDGGKKILIDCGPDFRSQMLANAEPTVDALLVTHEHNDHIIGLDDMRPIIFQNEKNLEIYCSQRVGTEIKKRFAYAFSEEKYPGVPSFDLNVIENKPFQLLDTEIVPIEVIHSRLPIFGYKIKNLAYITDASFISDEEKQKLQDVDILILNCLRKTNPHHSHFILPDVIKLYEELTPKKIYLTHISHQFGKYVEEEVLLPSAISLAYDGLEIFF